MQVKILEALLYKDLAISQLKIKKVIVVLTRLEFVL
jgi:hypothetical protein